MKILVTGATGFLGSALVRALVLEGAEVHVLVRPFSPHRSRLQDLPVVFHEGDVLEPASLQGLFAGMDGVIHAAGMLGQAGTPEATYHRLHVEGTRNVLSECAALPTPPKVVYVSSPGVLGPTVGQPADETAPIAPSNPYERSKAAAENAARSFNVPLVIARPEFIYGVGDDHVLGLFKAVQRGIFFYIGRQSYTCHPTYIQDAVDGILLCLHKGQVGETYHIMGPRAVSFGELAQTMARALGVRPPWLTVPRPLAWAVAVVLERLLGSKAPLTPTGVAFFSEDRAFSWQKAHRELGYTPQFDHERGIQTAVQWYKQKGWL